jgi:hypothetical protein
MKKGKSTAGECLWEEDKGLTNLNQPGLTKKGSQ